MLLSKKIDICLNLDYEFFYINEYIELYRSGVAGALMLDEESPEIFDYQEKSVKELKTARVNLEKGCKYVLRKDNKLRYMKSRDLTAFIRQHEDTK